MKANRPWNFLRSLILPQKSDSQNFESYEDWCENFTLARLRVATNFGLVAIPFFAITDFLLYRDHIYSLLVFRTIMESGFVLFYFGLQKPVPFFKVKVILVSWIFFSGACIAHMTKELGGFSSTYYNGIGLAILAAGVLIPTFWKSHLIGQICAVSYYIAINLFQTKTLATYNAGVESSFFLTWTSLAVLLSVYLYERLQRTEFDGRLKLEQSNRKLRELDRLKGEFFANISHELRTPLTLILGALKTLKKVLHQHDYQEILQAGMTNSNRLLYLINELLDLAKFDSGKTDLHKQCIDLSSLIRGVAASFQSSKGRWIHFRGLTRPVPIQADPSQLKKVVYNLLSNAFKFNDADEGQIWIKLNQRTDSIQLEFEDNGIGIAPEQLNKIFDRFTQVEGSTTRRYEGSGIGLALVKEVVKLHEGSIAVESKVGEGSTFTITLPRGTISSDDMMSFEEEEDQDISSSHHETEGSVTSNDPMASPKDAPLILIADDNVDMRGYLARILGKDFRICLAANGLEALEQAKTIGPDLILTDIMMPHMSGNDLLHAVRNDSALATTPIIFLTARAGTEARVESLEAGADDYIPKPFDDSEVLARISNVLRTRRAEKTVVELQKEKLSRFLPTHIGELVLSGTAENFLKGHRTEITIVFVDLRGFTSFAESAEPEDTIGLLCEYQTATGRIITEHNGTLERFTGDGMMIFFNDPIPVLNHHEKAIQMAVAMLNKTMALLDQWKKRGFELGIGIGIASGYATLGVIGFENRHEYTAIGSVTNLAARLCMEAQDGQILVPERFIESVSSIVESEFLGNKVMKGFHKPVSIHRITGIRQ